MNVRRILLGLGGALVIGGIAALFAGADATAGWVAMLLGLVGIIAGTAPDQLLTVFKIPELRRKIFITLLFLAAYRIGYYVPLPMIDQAKMAQKMADGAGGTLGKVFGFVSMFSGGNLSQACIFAVGIMPYISASIIIQLLSSGVLPSLERLRKEGESGRKKINEYTRYLTVPICIVQSVIYYRHLISAESSDGGGMGLAIPGYNEEFNLWYFGFAAVLMMTCGCLFLMWLGEQIDEYGIGNGISLIIMAGIVSRIPEATGIMLFEPGTTTIKESLLTLGGGSGDTSFEMLLVLIFLFLAVVVGVIAITKAQRRIPTQSAKHVRGRRTFGGTRNFLPMKVNAAGVMPVIFASTLLIVPGFLFATLAQIFGAPAFDSLARTFQDHSGWVYNAFYVLMIYVFCYFWVAITFNPKEIADNLKDHGSFIPGYRPGKSTADYLEKVLMRITYVGAAFLAVIAIIPSVISSEMKVPPQVAAFYGGTGLLIVISVALDLVQKINSHLVMRNYPGLTEE
jgi:preprotein translocase subunit SecY